MGSIFSKYLSSRYIIQDLVTHFLKFDCRIFFTLNLNKVMIYSFKEHFTLCKFLDLKDRFGSFIWIFFHPIVKFTCSCEISISCLSFNLYLKYYLESMSFYRRFQIILFKIGKILKENEEQTSYYFFCSYFVILFFELSLICFISIFQDNLMVKLFIVPE